MRKLATIQKITNIREIPGATSIDVASVLGWNVVVEKGKFSEGELICYMEVDSLLPLREEFSFLEKGGGIKKMLIDGKEVQGYRLKTIKLRGQISQGLVMPLSILPEITYIETDDETGRNYEAKDERIEGEDVTKTLGVHKYEPPMSADLAGKARGHFPGFIPKTDEPRLQSNPFLLERYKNEPFVVTEKIDGSSVTFFIKNGEFHVCGRTIDWLDDGKNSMWKLAKEMDIEAKLRQLNDKAGKEKYALQGEIYGEGIQKNPLKIKGQKISFYNLYDFVKGRYADNDDLVVLTNEVKLPIVPNVYDPSDNDVSWYVRPTVDEMVELSKIKSVINPDVWLEGLVWRPIHGEMQDPDLGRLSFKVINPEYLLKHE